MNIEQNEEFGLHEGKTIQIYLYYYYAKKSSAVVQLFDRP